MTFATVFHAGRAKLLLCALVAAAALVGTARSVEATTLPSGFSETVYATGLSAPNSFAFLPDNRILVCQQNGQLRIIDAAGNLLATPFVTITVNSSGERGLLGVAVDPDFSTNNYVYVYYTATTPSIHNRISRFTASGNVAMPGSELVLLDFDNLSGATNHNGGALHFGPDGKLYQSAGENANGSNSQTLSNLLGKIIRINKDGTIPTDNPFYNTPGARKEIWCYGLRNPWRFSFQPGTDALFIADVGQNTYEEVDIGLPGSNYGWPTMEGFHCQPPATMCTMTGFTLPIFEYNHNGGGASITGGDFYEGSTFPTEYVGSYFYGDYVNSFIRRLVLDGNNNVISDEPFATGAGGPVEIVYHGDAMWYTSVNTGQLRRITYTGGANRSPVAVATGAPGAGLAPFVVNFSSAGTYDPDNDTLTYDWDFGDGTSHSSAPNPMHTYSGAPRTVNAKLTVTDNGSPNLSDTSPNIPVVIGDSPPTATITSPVNLSNYNAGQTISYSGTGSDPENGTLAAGAFTWKIIFHHNTHIHPFLGPITGVTSGSFVVPDLGENSTDVWYEIILTVVDSQGVTDTKSVRINPNTVNLTVNGVPAGLSVSLGGQPLTTPTPFASVVGFKWDVDVPLPQMVGGTNYSTFSNWSDGGARLHTITAPASATTYTAVAVGDTAPPRTPIAGDWNNDGTGSIGLWFRSTAAFAQRNSNSPGSADFFYNYGPNYPGWVALSGDWDGNGTRTPGLFDPATNFFYLRNSNSPGPADVVFGFGGAGNGLTPITGDWDGDGDDTIGLYDPASGAFFLRNTNSSGPANLTFTFGAGGAGFVPVVGDWDGNNTTTIGLYNPATSAFFLKNSNSSGSADIVFSFGAAGQGYQPIAGNWDATAGESIGLYSAVPGSFFLKNTNSGGNADLVFNFGPTGP